METNRKIMTLTATVLLGLMLGACSDTASNTATPSATTPAPSNEATSPETTTETSDPAASNEGTETPIATDNESTNNSSGTTEQTDARPDSQSFEMLTKDGLKKFPATLKKGNGYSLYVFDGFTFDSSANQLMMTDKPRNTASIEKLSSKINLDDLRKQGKAELKKHGEVKEYSGDLLAESPMSRAHFVLQAISQEDNSTYEYIVWQPEGENGYIFHTVIPEGEDAGTIEQKLTTSLSTIKAE
ncbi:hypothetical protein [Paenibacillus kandeliae]|uniref:hypothetical protein n=1 Tax=Paenibacillus kandeliae TaxID=3231269 RepID=UPI003458F803